MIVRTGLVVLIATLSYAASYSKDYYGRSDYPVRSYGARHSNAKPHYHYKTGNEDYRPLARGQSYWDICTTSLHQRGHCQPISLCSSGYGKPPVEDHCILSSGRSGVCCPLYRNETNLPSSRSYTSLPYSAEDINVCAQNSYDVMKGHKRINENLLSAGLYVKQGTPSFGHHRHTASPIHCLEYSTKAFEVVHATKMLKERYNLKKDDIIYGLRHVDLSHTSMASACLPNPICRPSKYRSLDGSCNNIQNPRWGMAYAPLQRVLPPAYSDDVWEYRKSTSGKELPCTRLISTTLYPDENNPDPKYTLMLMQFGQFIAHDMTHAAAMSFENGAGINCCGPNSTMLPENSRHYACMEITVPEDDEFFSHFGHKCMNFVRSMLAPKYDCTLGYGEQMNQVTHFLDGSVVYGSNDETASSLRTYKHGTLKTFMDYGRSLLPLDDPHKKDCLTQEDGTACFIAGDSRANQKITLVAVHTLFLREHNRIAHELLSLNPHWSDEMLYQEARRIVVAEIQHITYNEYLPHIVGTQAMRDYGLISNQWYSDDYDSFVNPSVTNGFLAAAFRYGHSTVDTRLWVYEEEEVDEVIYLPDVMFLPGKMRNREFYDRILNTLTTQPMQSFDPFVSEALTRYMFRAGNPFGLDLISINIQRGRDHGMPCYNEYREICGLRRATCFEDLEDAIPHVFIRKMRELYEDVEDIDLYVGGLSERPNRGSVVGPTFACIIADQFARLKRGDRFFYDIKDQQHSFNRAQLRELKKVTLARIVCDNNDNIEVKKMAPNVFVRNDLYINERVPCHSDAIPRLDISHWKE